MTHWQLCMGRFKQQTNKQTNKQTNVDEDDNVKRTHHSNSLAYIQVSTDAAYVMND